MLAAMFVSALLVLTTILIHYEVLRTTSNHLRDLPIRPRLRIIVVVIMAFVAHTFEVWLYGVAYWALDDRFGLGAIRMLSSTAGEMGFLDHLYFSTVTFTTIGFGDLVPTGHFRLIAGVQGLNGLILIGWSASFTYLAMERYWPLHLTKERPRHELAGDQRH